MYRIALCIVSHNRRPYTERALTPVLEQLDEGGQDLRLFVYDNASHDSTPKYLREIEARHENVTVVLGKRDIGAVAATAHLFEQHVLGRGFDVIARSAGDELLPADWTQVCDYWTQFEAAGGVVVGFKRQGLDDYFNGLEWVSRSRANLRPVEAGPYIGFLSYTVPGFQMTTEENWRRILPHVSVCGQGPGGWDVALARTVRDVLGQQCLVIFNRLSVPLSPDGSDAEYAGVGPGGPVAGRAPAW